MTVFPVPRVLLCLASPRTSLSWAPTENPLRAGTGVYRTGLRMILQDFYTGFLYGYGIQSILLCVLTIALSDASAPTPNYSLALSLYAALLIVLTIVHLDSTSILSLHSW
jgi:hypothetical protein